MAAQKSQKGSSRALLLIGMVIIVGLTIGGVAYLSRPMPTVTGGDPITVPARPMAVTSVKESLKAYRGKVVVLNFWATWCGPCRVEIPDFVKLQQEYRDQGLEFIGVSLDPITPGRGNGAGAVEPFMKSYNINYAIWTVNDPKALSGYDVSRGIPTTYILNRDGEIVKSYVGVRSRAVFENDIKMLL